MDPGVGKGPWHGGPFFQVMVQRSRVGREEGVWDTCPRFQGTGGEVGSGAFSLMSGVWGPERPPAGGDARHPSRGQGRRCPGCRP